MTEYKTKVPNDEHEALVFTLKEFADMVQCGAITIYDGVGYFAKDGMTSYEYSNSVYSGVRPEDVTHVVWFNR